MGLNNKYSRQEVIYLKPIHTYLSTSNHHHYRHHRLSENPEKSSRRIEGDGGKRITGGSKADSRGTKKSSNTSPVTIQQNPVADEKPCQLHPNIEVSDNFTFTRLNIMAWIHLLFIQFREEGVLQMRAYRMAFLKRFLWIFFRVGVEEGRKKANKNLRPH